MGLLRKVIRISCEDSPNVQLAREQIARGEEPTGEVVVPGVIGWADLVHHRKVWDKERQQVGLDAVFPEGRGSWMFPADWRLHSMRLARELAARGATRGQERRGKAVGVDSAEGGDSTVWTVIDDLGVLEQLTMLTPDTSVITGQTLGLMRKWGVPAGRTFFDRGGGGYEHACNLRAQGFDVRTVGFGERPHAEPSRPGRVEPFRERVEKVEERYVFETRRVEMHFILRGLMDPGPALKGGFAIPEELTKLHQQMALVPLMYDDKGKGIMVLPPKEELFPDGSPDELDSAVVAAFALTAPAARTVAGAMR